MTFGVRGMLSCLDAATGKLLVAAKHDLSPGRVLHLVIADRRRWSVHRSSSAEEMTGRRGEAPGSEAAGLPRRKCRAG